MISVTNSIFEGIAPSSQFPKTSRWNRKHSEVAQVYYYWTVSVWRYKDPAIFDLINNGTLEETTDSYVAKKSFTWDKKFIHTDKIFKFDQKLNIIINNSHFVSKDNSNGTIQFQPKVKDRNE